MDGIASLGMLCPGILLLITAYEDWKKREVNVWLLLVFGALGILRLLLPKPGSPAALISAFGGAAIGAVVMGVSRLTRGAIGMGDGMLLVVTGIYIGFWDNMSIFLAGSFFAALLSIMLLLMKKATKKTSCPFIPFLLLGFLCVKLL